MSRRTPPTLQSFLPELLEVWRKAATEPVNIPTKDSAAATRLRARLYSLRKALERENHDLYKTARFATITIDGNVVRIQPADLDLKQTLNDAGITTPDVPDIDFGDLDI